MDKRRYLLVVLLISIVTLIQAHPVVAPQNAPSCCTFEISGDYCLPGGYGNGQFPDITDCCGIDENCRSNGFHTRDCDSTLCPDFGSDLTKGCCLDECRDAFQFECQNPGNFKTSPCSATTECARGCCRCIDTGTETAALNFQTEDQCRSECIVTRNSDDFLFDLDTGNCVLGVARAQTFSLQGIIRDPIGNPISNADIVIIDVDAKLSNSNGEFHLDNIPAGTYNLRISKTRFKPIFVVLTIDSSTNRDFTLKPLDGGRIYGTVFHSENRQPLQDAVITIKNFDFQLQTDSTGLYTIFLPFSQYELSAKKSGFDDVSQNILVTDEHQVDFFLPPQLVTDIRFTESTRKQGIITTIIGQGSCTTDNLGQCKIEGIQAGRYSWRAHKDNIHQDATGTIQVTTADVTFNVIRDINFRLPLKNNLCNIKNEYVLTGTCSKANKPSYCLQGEVNPLTKVQILNTVNENSCYGPDEVIGFRCQNDPTIECSRSTQEIDCGTGQLCVNDDCGCDIGFACNRINGQCTPEGRACTDSCSFLGIDNTCHSECQGTNGCQFADDFTVNACDGKQIGELITLTSGPNTGKSVTCCTGPPFNFGEEDCTTNLDEDGDGFVGCLDSDCFHKSCDSDPAFICRGQDYNIGCFRKLCSEGLIDTDGCLCGDTQSPGIVGSSGEFCCPLTGEKFSTKSGFDASTCGNTQCKLGANPGGVCCRGCDNNIARAQGFNLNNYLSLTCGRQGINCCPPGSCQQQAEFICDHPAQCDQSYPPGNLIQSTLPPGKFACKVPCKKIDQCLQNTPINTPLNWQRNLCQCSDTIVEFPSPPGPSNTYAGIFCCKSGDELFLSSTRCNNEPDSGTLKGKVQDSFFKTPIPLVLVETDTGIQSLTDLNGEFEFKLSSGARQIAFSRQTSSPVYKSLLQSYNILKDSEKQVLVELERVDNPCLDEPRPLQGFTAKSIPGEVRKVILQWQPPKCTNVEFYKIIASYQPGAVLTFDHDQFEYMDEIPLDFPSSNGPFGLQITYSIIANYGPLGESPPLEVTFQVGDKDCEDITDQEFCSGNQDARLRCSNENQKEIIRACDCNTRSLSNNPSIQEIEEFRKCSLCSGPDKEGKTSCKTANSCDIFKQNAYPFGLYYDKETCNGVDSSNFCYYDSYISDKNPLFETLPPLPIDLFSNPTAVDRCIECSINMECYSYKSKGACNTDNCGISNCNWLETPYSELGSGFCYKEDYKGTDKCKICSKESELFTNALCTQEVCSSLGRCFSKDPMWKHPDNLLADTSNGNILLETELSCNSCDDAVCEDLITQDQCEGPNGIEITDTINPSKDVCNFGKCSWISNRCVKDGNANNKVDCEEEIKNNRLVVNRNTNDCREDLLASETLLISPQDFSELGADPQELIFTTKDAIPNIPDTFGMVYFYCINTDNTCIPNIQLAYDNEFVTLRDDGINGVLRDYIKNVHNSKPGKYYLRYYTLDMHFNQEETQSILYYADIKAPVLEVNPQIILGEVNDLNPLDTESVLDIIIRVDELSKCSDKLQKVDPESENGLVDLPTIIKSINPISGEINPKYNIKDGTYFYKIDCTDQFGNTANFQKQLLVDAFHTVDIISPPLNEVINTNSVEFIVQTADPASCTLFPPGSPGLRLIPDSSSIQHNLHLTLPERQSTHFIGYVATCTPIGSQESDVANFVFTLDLTPPNANIIMDDELRHIERATNNWEAVFGSDITVAMECSDPLTDPNIKGTHFGPILPSDVEASNTFGCIADTVLDTCDPKENFISNINDGLISGTQKICYSCQDNGRNKLPTRCGIISLDDVAPIFQLKFYADTDQEVNTFNSVPILTRDTPSIFYQLKLDVLNEKTDLKFTPKIILNINGVQHAGEIRVKKINKDHYEGIFAIPYTKEFDNLNIDDKITFIVTGTDAFGNSGKLEQPVIFSTTIPKPPILNDFGQNVKVKYTKDASTFRQTGLEADKISFRDIILETGITPNKKGGHVPSGSREKLTSITENIFSSSDFVVLPEVITSGDPGLTITAKLQESSGSQLTLRDVPIDFDLSFGSYANFPSKQKLTREFYKIDSVLDPITISLQNNNVNNILENQGFKTFTILNNPSRNIFASLSMTEISPSTPNLDVEIYREAVPKAWFTNNVPLIEGSNWFFAYAIDETGLIGESTEVKKVILDNSPPEIIYTFPAQDTTIQSSPIKVIMVDPNSGIDYNSVKLTVDNQQFKCTPTTCSGLKEFIMDIDAGLSPGLHTLLLEAEDFSGNSLTQGWSFTVHPDSYLPIITTNTGNCPNQCYFNQVRPNLTLKYPPQVQLQKATMHSNQNINVDITNSLDGFLLIPVEDLHEGKHILEVQIKVSNITINQLYEFVIDITSPIIQLDQILTTRTPNILLSGNYLEEYIDKIEFKGDINDAINLVSSELPSDISNQNSIFTKDLTLAVSNLQNIEATNRQINVSIHDKAGNTITAFLDIIYDIVLPKILNLTVTNNDPARKLEIFNLSHYKTNDNTVIIAGNYDKQLKEILLRSESITKIANINNELKTFFVEFNILNSLSPTRKETITLIATDEVGNSQEVSLIIELDIFKPEVTIRWL